MVFLRLQNDTKNIRIIFPVENSSKYDKKSSCIYYFRMLHLLCLIRKIDSFYVS